MKTKIIYRLSIIILSSMMIIFLEGSKLTNEKLKPNEEIKPYVGFLRKQNTSAKNYILRLFEKNDIVIICERSHPELTQYDLILDVCKDPRFIEKVGNVFIEVCVRNQEGNIKQLLRSNGIGENKAKQLILDISRNNSIHPFWGNYNFSYFLNGLYQTNKNLALDKKINLFPSDIPIDWSVVDSLGYSVFNKSLAKRDKSMAEYIISKFDSIQSEEGKRKKALIIMNYRHAFGNKFMYPNNLKPDNVGRYLFEKYEDRVANVLINSVALTNARSDNDVDFAAIQRGKWDASFKVQKLENVGFDFSNNPFGNDPFDLWPFTKHNFKYSDVFNGFVFYMPLDKQRFVHGTPGIIDSLFCKKLERRYQIVEKVTGRKMNIEEPAIWRWNNIEENNFIYNDSIKSEIFKWIK